MHTALDAKMTDFAGYDMPVQYAGLSKNIGRSEFLSASSTSPIWENLSLKNVGGGIPPARHYQ